MVAVGASTTTAVAAEPVTPKVIDGIKVSVTGVEVSTRADIDKLLVSSPKPLSVTFNTDAGKIEKVTDQAATPQVQPRASKSYCNP